MASLEPDGTAATCSLLKRLPINISIGHDLYLMRTRGETLKAAAGTVSLHAFHMLTPC